MNKGERHLVGAGCRVEFRVLIRPSSLLQYLTESRAWSLDSPGNMCSYAPQSLGKRFVESFFSRRGVADLAEVCSSQDDPYEAVVAVSLSKEEIARHDERLSRIIKDEFGQVPCDDSKAILLAEERIDIERLFGNCLDVEVVHVQCRWAA